MQTFSDSWKKIEAYIRAGISLIPVREKDDDYAVAKTPYKGWKRYQTEIITTENLFHDLEVLNTQATAFICGAVSGNLEAIDVDSKYYRGIDAVLFNDIKTIYPDIFAKLRIHRTPSGGYHIIYRIKGEAPPGNQKLASRLPNEQELEENPKARAKCFIETRGEGGYILSDSSEGYSVVQDKPIPELSWDERCSLIELAKSFNEVVIESKNALSKPASDSDYYDENPFEHFAKSPEAERFLEDYGWKEHGRNNHFIWFTRPGKDKGVSASFNLQKRIIYVFTSSTEFQPDTGYFPAKALSILRDNDDGKVTYRKLVEAGYGKINKRRERSLVKYASGVHDLPANISESARTDFEVIKRELDDKYPFGLYWVRDERMRVKISRERLYQVAAGLGFRYHNGDIMKITGYKIKKSDKREFFDDLRTYIKEEEEHENIEIADCLEAFLQKSGLFSMERIQKLEEDKLLKDTKLECFKLYLNGYLRITANSCELLPYDTIPKLIFEERINQRDYFEHPRPEDTVYVKYLELAIDMPEQPEYFKQVMGYLTHEYKDDTMGYIVVMTERCPNPKDGGGSGKNLFANLLGLSTTIQSTPSEQAHFDEKFLQAWNGQRIFAVHDVPKHFNFAFLKELSTGSATIKKLYRDEYSVKVGDMPKFIISTNYSYEISDGGLRRRIIPIEFTDFFTRNKGIDSYFGMHFPNDWTEDDWSGYDTFMATSIQAWMRCGYKLNPAVLSEGGWEKQFEHEHGVLLHSFIKDNIEGWMGKHISTADFNNQYEKFCNEENVAKNYRASSIKMNAALKAYCDKKEIIFIPSVIKRHNNILDRYKFFWRRSAVLIQ